MKKKKIEYRVCNLKNTFRLIIWWSNMDDEHEEIIIVHFFSCWIHGCAFYISKNEIVKYKKRGLQKKHFTKHQIIRLQILDCSLCRLVGGEGGGGWYIFDHYHWVSEAAAAFTLPWLGALCLYTYIHLYSLKSHRVEEYKLQRSLWL